MSDAQLDIQMIAVVTAAACAIPGTFLVLRRMAMMSDAISHSILLGIVIGFFIVESTTSPVLILFAAAPVRAGIITRKLLDLPPYVLAPLGHPITGRAASLSDVAAHPLVLLDRPVAEPYVTALFRDRGLAPRQAAPVPAGAAPSRQAERA